MSSHQIEIAQAAAALIVEEGMEAGPAKRHALKQLGLPARTALPDNRTVEEAVREYIELFRADEQPQELAALRALALDWMERLAVFSPLVGGAVWNGTATRHSAIHLQLFHDDSKALPIQLLNDGLRFETEEATGLGHQDVEVLVLELPSHHHPALDASTLLCLWNNSANAQRGALQPERDGRTLRGTAQGLRQRMAQSAA